MENIENMESKLINVNISEQMQNSFLDYSMSVIVARALPDVRDGLKPVHRRILYTMMEEGFTPDKKHVKSANTVGNVLAHYHPHGDAAVYDTMVRMAQDFNYRLPLVDGHGNFGSIDGYSAAAQRYTEAKLAKISMELLRDLNKNTVDFTDNYDGERKEPTVLPSRFPNILVNGTMGIAVGMATNIPPHNLKEVINGCIAKIDNPLITTEELMEHVKGPDFPTGGIILGNSGIKKAYETGKGVVVIRAKAHIEEHNNRQRIVITEIPYQVNKIALITKIADLVRNKQIDGISDLRDETDLKGIKIVVEIKREANANVVLNNLYKFTQLQVSYGINLLALDDGQPKVLTLNEILEKYLNHQKIVIIRRTKYDLDKAKRRAHILEGLKIALDNIDDIISLIKNSKSDDEAIKCLMNNYSLSEDQAQAILEMKLRRLTGLEKEKIEAELAELLKTIANLESILASDEKILAIIKEEMIEIRDKYADERRTSIDMTAIEYIEDESLIPVENIVITLTNKGYIKRVPVDTYKSQNRGGVGVKGMTTNEEDFVEHLVSMKTHDYVLFFTNKGRVYRIKGYEIPEYGRQSKGLPIINLLSLDKEERINSLIHVSQENSDTKYLLFVTKNGIVKRTDIKEFENIRTSGKIAIILKEEDELIAVRKTTGDNQIIIGTSGGRMVRFSEDEIRAMGRSSSGVKGVDLLDAVVVGSEVVTNDQQVLIVTEKGYGKKTDIEEYRLTHRGSKGVKALNITEKNGNMVALKCVNGDEDLMIITDSGVIMRMPMEQISTLKRATQGVRLINLKDQQKVATVATIMKEETTEDKED